MTSLYDPPLFAPEPRETPCDRLGCYGTAEYGCARCDRGVCGRHRLCEEHWRRVAAECGAEQDRRRM